MSLRQSIVTTSKEKFAKWLGSSGTAALRMFPPEFAHDLAMFAMQHGLLDFVPCPHLEPLTTGFGTNVPGIGRLSHPIGLAAGFDKNCQCPQSFAKLGMSFVEIGTITPRPQPGNAKPRLFRQKSQLALINRMGFNNDGAQEISEKLKRMKWNSAVPLGVNAGKNKDTPLDRAVVDYVQVVEAFSGLCQYYVVNISSPNTVGLRDLASVDFIESLADELGAHLPKVWIKLDPDMQKDHFQKLIEVIVDRGFQGVLLSNTHRVVTPEVGGQSGHPLMGQSTACLEWAWEVHKGQLPMIASGGILSGADIYQKLIRGALAVQIYTALVYRGSWVVMDLLTELAAELDLRGYACVEDAIGTYY